MDQKLITHALALPEAASERDILDRIRELRMEAGEDDVADLNDRELIRRGEHDRVSVTSEGAVVSLYFPLRSGTEVLSDLTIRRPTAKHLRRMNAAKAVVGGAGVSGLDRGLALLADTTGRAIAELDGLDAADLQLCLVVCSFLQAPPQRTGSRS